MTYARFARRAKVLQARRSATKGLIRRTLLAERLEERSMMAADLMPANFKSDYWNSNIPADVNADGTVAPLDAILVINRLNNGTAGALPQGAAGEAAQAAIPEFVDVNNDGVVAPIDAVLVINALNAEGEGPNGEIVQYTIRAIKPGSAGDPAAGDVLTSIQVGQDYDLQVVVDDLRADVGSRGVFSGYLDILYSNKALTSVRVAEVQSLLLDRGGAGQTGTFTLTVDGETTAPITNAGNDVTMAGRIKAAIGALPSIGGANNIDVQTIGLPTGTGANTMDFLVRFVGSFDVDHANIIGNMSGINASASLTVVEEVKGTIPGTSQSTPPKDSFTEAFRSRTLPPDVFGSPYQNSLFAGDAADRIDDVGALADIAPTGAEPVELVRVRMRANQAGTLVLTGSVANTIPDIHDTVVYANVGESSAVAKNQILIQNATLTITPLTTPNAAPVNTVPAAQNINETQTVVFSQANGNRISVADADAGSAALQMTLAVTNGTLTLGSLAGLTFTTGDGTGDATMTFTGSQTAINAALSGLTFTPTASGTATLTITTNDQGNSGVDGPKIDTDTVTINVTGINDAPVVTVPGAQSVAFTAASNLAFNTGAGTAISINDSDAGTANIQVTVGVTSGTLTATGGGVTGSGTSNLTFTGSQAAINAALQTLVFAPVPNVVANVTLTVTANDQGNSGSGGAKTGSGTVSISVVSPVRPFALPDAATIAEGSTAPQTIDVLFNDLETVGSNATLVSFAQPPAGQGTVTLFDNGTASDLTDDRLIYTGPGGDFFGTVTFTYVMNETPEAPTPNGPSTGTVTVTITNTNDIPVAVADSFQASTDANLVVTPPGVLGNDTDADNLGTNVDPLTAVLVTGPSSGTLSLNANGGFTYIPSGGGTFSFSYRARDAALAESAPAVVTIAVSAPPTANPDGPFAATEDTTFTSTTSLVANDQDFSIPPTPLTAVIESQPTVGGTVTINGDNTFTYTPTPNFNTTRPATAPVTFTYRASAAGRVSAPATVTINVAEVNDNPTANPDTFQAVKRNGTVGVDQTVLVLGNDSDAPDGGETLSVVSVTPATTPLGGSVRVEGGVIKYTSPTVVGTDSFSYTISDGRGGTATATVTVTVVDFVPKDVTGRVFLDDNNNGVIDGSEKGLGGVTVNLTGTDFTNAAVSLSTTTDANGNYAFLGMRPGTYTLQEIQPLYLLDGIDTEASNLVTKPANTNDRFTLTWDAIDQSGPITNVNFAERGVNISSLTDARGVIQELQASSQPAEGFWLATDLSGTARWSFTLAGWQNAAGVTFDLNSDLSGGLLTVRDASGATYTRTLLVYPNGGGFDAPRIRIIGQAANGDRIIRIDCTAAQLGLNLLAAPQVAAAAVPQGEGEGAQFAEAADALFAGQAWA